jgi:hypothetical protein
LKGFVTNTVQSYSKALDAVLTWFLYVEKPMTEAQANRNSRDRQHINPSDGYELNYWTRQLRCSEQDLRSAIAVVGPDIAAVRAHLQAKRQRGDDDLVWRMT